MESKNPVFNRSPYVHQQKGWAGPDPTPGHLQDMYERPPHAETRERAMTIDDVVVRSALTLGTLVATGTAAWVLNVPMTVGIVAAIIGVVLGLIASFKQSTNPALILGYAAFYGVFVGVFSHLMENRFEGVVLQATIGTAVAFASVLTVYSLRIVRVTPKLTKFVVAAAIGALVLMLINMLAGFFVPGGLGLRADNPMGWIFSVAMILLGCFFLLLDFDDAERAVKAGAPAKYSWQCAFGLTLSLVWIYLEVLRLVSYFSGND